MSRPNTDTQQVTIRDGASGETWRCDGDEYVVVVANEMVGGHQPVISNFRCSPGTMVRIVAALTLQGTKTYGDSFVAALDHVLKVGNFDSEVLS